MQMACRQGTHSCGGAAGSCTTGTGACGIEWRMSGHKGQVCVCGGGVLVVGLVASSRQVVKAVTDAQHTRPGVHLKTG